MSIFRSRVVLAVCICVFIVMFAAVQPLLHFLSIYPDALIDLMINQELIRIRPSTSKFKHTVALGRSAMLDSSVTFVGVGKQVDKNLVHNLLDNLDILSRDFAFSRFIFVVDSSARSMQEIFKHWASQSPYNRVILISTPPLMEPAGLFPNSEHVPYPREGKIAQARNMALAEYQKGPATDYIINIDLDIIGWDLSGVRDSFGQEHQWDVACANGIILYGIYRDAYAFRMPGVETNHHLSGRDHAHLNFSAAESLENHRLLVVGCASLPCII